MDLPRKHLSSNAFNDSDDMTSIQRLLLVVDLFLLDQQQRLSLDLDIVILLLGRSLAKTTTPPHTAGLGSLFSIAASGSIVRAVVGSIAASVGTAGTLGDVLSLLLLLFLTLLTPDFIHVEELNSNQVALQRSVPVLTSADEDIGVQQPVLGSHICVTSILLVDTKNTGNQLSITQQRWQTGLRKVGGKECLALLLLLVRETLAALLTYATETELLHTQCGLLHLKLSQLLWLEQVGVQELTRGRVNEDSLAWGSRNHEVGLRGKVEGSNGGTKGRSLAMSGLEALVELLVLVLVLDIHRRIGLVLARITPVVLVVSRRGSAVTLEPRVATTAFDVLTRLRALLLLLIGGSVCRRGELESTESATGCAPAIHTNRKTLTASVASPHRSGLGRA